MKNRWLNLCQHLFRPEESDKTPERLYQYLEAMYNRVGYHTLSHIQDCLSMLDRYRMLFDVNNIKTIEFALWLHDAVYYPGDSNNEIESANLAETMIRELSQNTAYSINIQDVRRLILATVPFENSISEDERIISDIDLSILGSDTDTYKKYTQAIYDEFCHVDDFFMKRKQFMKKVFQSTKEFQKFIIFQTDIMRNMFEYTARVNIDREIQLL